jgi:hypothetical protein
MIQELKQSLVIDAGNKLTKRRSPLDRLENDVSIRVSVSYRRWTGKLTQQNYVPLLRVDSGRVE